MQSTSVRKINEAIYVQAMNGKRIVRNEFGFRVTRTRKTKGQLQARLLDGSWVNVESVSIDWR